MIVDSLDMTPSAFRAGTGWEIKPEGACKADVCVPLGGGPFSARQAAERLGMAVVHDEQAALWAFGPESLSSRALVSAVAPELVLDDWRGDSFRLSSLRGRKVAVVSWAPY
ncbi:MAG: hypothetical protein Q7V88_01615 [Actinomycetota bacterium]|nr:hypothetical protein [Actinomycetota bacterium]